MRWSVQSGRHHPDGTRDAARRLPASSGDSRHGGNAARWRAREGCSPQLLPDDNPRFSTVVFEYDGEVFRAGVDERDPDFLSVSFGILYDPPLDELTALRVANAVQDTHKVIRIGVERGARLLMFQAPVFLRGLPPTRSLLDRCVALLRHTAGEFDDLLRGTTKARA